MLMTLAYGVEGLHFSSTFIYINGVSGAFLLMESADCRDIISECIIISMSLTNTTHSCYIMPRVVMTVVH